MLASSAVACKTPRHSRPATRRGPQPASRPLSLRGGRPSFRAAAAQPGSSTGGAAAPDGSLAGQDAPQQQGAETVQQWLARHANDPAELRRQAPVWAALEWVLGGSRRQAVELVRCEPSLLAMASSLVASNVRVMQRQLGMGGAEVAESVRRCPQLFLRDYSGESMQKWFVYLPEVLGVSAREVLAEQPHLFLRSFSGMVCKVGFMQHKGDDHYKKTLIWLSMNHADFCWKFGYEEAELQEWIKGWEAHRRHRWVGM